MSGGIFWPARPLASTDRNGLPPQFTPRPRPRRTLSKSWKKRWHVFPRLENRRAPKPLHGSRTLRLKTQAPARFSAFPAGHPSLFTVSRPSDRKPKACHGFRAFRPRTLRPVSLDASTVKPKTRRKKVSPLDGCGAVKRREIPVRLPDAAQPVGARNAHKLAGSRDRRAVTSDNAGIITT